MLTHWAFASLPLIVFVMSADFDAVYRAEEVENTVLWVEPCRVLEGIADAG